MLDEPSHDPVSRIHQLRTITTGYRALTDAEPLLPAPYSPLPALLALRNSNNSIDQTKTSITVTEKKIVKDRELLSQEEDDIRDSRLLHDALEKRVEKLRVEHADQSQKPSETLAKEIIQEQHQRKIHYVKELRKLVKAFNKFVEEHLAAMLAAEELGGPVVGDMVDINEDTLEASFNKLGKAKKARSEGTDGNDERMRRIEGIWGPQSENEDVEMGERSIKDAAHADFRKLTENLLNAAAGEGDSAPYVQLHRETAAVRFLVREKVAQFDPNDARKLRLVDFASAMPN